MAKQREKKERMRSLGRYNNKREENEEIDEKRVLKQVKV